MCLRTSWARDELSSIYTAEFNDREDIQTRVERCKTRPFLESMKGTVLFESKVSWLGIALADFAKSESN